MWLQGFEQAPQVVKECQKTWESLNPEWEIITLDETNVHQYVDVEPILAKQRFMEKAAIADIIRIKLLAKYGGVWVDATCHCQNPLDSWLEGVTRSGFFAFHKPVKESLVAIWFLAVSENNHLMAKWAEAAETYVLSSPDIGQRPKTRRWFKWFSTNTSTTRYWFSYPIRRVFKVYPYYWLMYLFAEVVRKDTRSQQIWEQTPKLIPPNPGQMHKDNLLTPLTEQLKAEIDSKKAPLYKLSWRYNSENYSEDCVLEYILTSGQQNTK